MLKSLLLPALVIFAVLGAVYGVGANGEEPRGLLFAALCAAFLACDSSLWSRA